MQNPSEVKKTKDVLSVREALSTKKEDSRKESEAEFSNFLDHSDDDEAGFDARMRQQILRKRKELDDLPTKKKSNKGTLLIWSRFLQVNPQTLVILYQTLFFSWI